MFQHLSNVRPVSIKDMEKFTSPWAVAAEDEEKFARTVSSVGRLLRDDLHLQVTKHKQVILLFYNTVFWQMFSYKFKNIILTQFYVSKLKLSFVISILHSSDL